MFQKCTRCISPFLWEPVISLPTWAIAMQEYRFLLLSHELCCNLQDIMGNLTQYVGHGSVAGILQACTSIIWIRDQDNCFFYYCLISFHKETRRLPLFSNVIRTDSTAHSFRKTAEQKGIAWATNPSWFNSARDCNIVSAVLGWGRNWKSQPKMHSPFKRNLNSVILFDQTPQKFWTIINPCCYCILFPWQDE